MLWPLCLSWAYASGSDVCTKHMHHELMGKLSICLKGPKHEIFGLRIFAQIRPIWIGYLGTRPKNPKSYVWGLILPFISRDFCVSAVGDSAKKISFWARSKKKVDLDCFYNHLFTIKIFFWFLIFYSVSKWFMCGWNRKNVKRTRHQR
jgi:hypothetical protein